MEVPTADAATRLYFFFFLLLFPKHSKIMASAPASTTAEDRQVKDKEKIEADRERERDSKSLQIRTED